MQKPIFLVGLPRSGTTWIAKILDSHPGILYRHEPDSWSPWNDVPLFAEADDTALQELVRKHIAAIPDITADRVAAKLPMFDKAFIPRWTQRRYRLGSLVQKAASRMGRNWRLVEAPGPPKDDSHRLAWKSIESLGRLGLVGNSLAGKLNAVRIVRHPCGYISSVLRGEAAAKFTGSATANDVAVFRMLCETQQGRRLGLHLDRLMGLTDEERLAWRWRVINEKAAEESVQRDYTYPLYYERLCNDPRGEARRLMQFCGLEWVRQTEKFVVDSTSRASKSYYSVFKDPLASAWSWNRELTGQQIAKITAVVASSPVAEPYLQGSDWVKQTIG